MSIFIHYQAEMWYNTAVMELDSLIEKNFRVTAPQKKALKKLGLNTLRDMLFYFPSRYENFSERKNIIDLREGDKTTVYGKIVEAEKQKTRTRRMPLSRIIIGDFTGTINALWFNQPYVTNILKIGDKVALTGKISNGKSGLYIANPTFEKVDSYGDLSGGGTLLSVYSETRGISSRWLRFNTQKILASISKTDLQDPIPGNILKKYHLPDLYSSLIYIHTPQNPGDAEAARKRFAFEEIFFIQLARLKERQEREKSGAFPVKISKKEMEDFLKIFPFELTAAQKKSINHIIEDFKKNIPMARLLEGDVGSGKTAVAVAAAYAIVKNKYQVAYMAPTEILARQHFKSFIEYFSQLRLTTKIGLLTSSECRKYPSKVSFERDKGDGSTHISKSQLLKWVESGEIPILIGTHSLIQKSVKFKKLALVIIDEQHRFGTRQRARLVCQPATLTNKQNAPHLLSMTATPIPRTLALTIYGDLDLSLLDEMPPGRKKIITAIVPPEQRQRAYEQIRLEIKKGRQAFVICPRIDEPDPEKEKALNIKSVKEEAERLRTEIFPELEIGILHGKMKPAEKEEALEEFKKNETQILVATSVIEVGIDIPNATMIIIEGAERFGLAQLHQLRGRVMRSSYQPYCFVFTGSDSIKTKERLEALEKAKSGFELAEYDLKFRGSGGLSGIKQWGVSDIGMEALKNIKMVEAARLESQQILKKDPELNKSPLIKERLSSQKTKIHFE